MTIYIYSLDKVKREVKFDELNEIVKDILWFFHENVDDPINAFVPPYSFNKSYWKYLNIDGDKFFYDQDKFLIVEGCMAIINGMICEYIDIPGGIRDIFENIDMKEIIEYVNDFQPTNEKQTKLKEITLLGLDIANSITASDFYKNEEYNHENLDEYYELTRWIDQNVTKKYFYDKIKEIDN